MQNNFERWFDVPLSSSNGIRQ